MQWDLNSADIPNSIQVVHSSNTISAGALQLGIDRRIYRAQFEFGNNTGASRFLGVIENPEADGPDIIYNEQGVQLDVGGFSQNTSRIGLPPFIQSLFFFTINVKNACIGKTSEFSINTLEKNFTVLWDFGDGTTSTEINPKHQYNATGFYPVSATMQLSNGQTDTIDKVIQIFDIT